MSHRPVAVLIEDIWEAIEKIQRYVGIIDREGFIRDDKTADSVVRNLEIIGEAANRIPEDFKLQHPQIEWRKMIGLRHRIVHDYFGIDLDIVWQIIQRDLPELQAKLNAIRKN